MVKNANRGRQKVIFEPSDLVWVHLRKERFPSQRKSKLSPRGDGPFRVSRRMGDNAYQIDLPSKYGVSTSFNVSDLTPFCAGREAEPRLMDQPFQEGEIDEGIDGASDPEEPLVGPRTRSQEQRRERSLLNQFQEFFDTNKVCEEGTGRGEEWVILLKQMEESEGRIEVEDESECWPEIEEGKAEQSIDRPYLDRSTHG